MTFYLKYRLQNLEELDLEGVRETLKKILTSQSIPHAFLFSGPKGSGKTSTARILAKVVNCEKPKASGNPCNTCNQCTSIANGTNIDVIEVDAASHRGIDDIRALRDAVKLAPVAASKKVYIIDEAHMLTTEASNALLKTLEEPPEHVIFILVTTNPEKLIETIRSRTTLISFKKGQVEEIVRALERVIQGEKKRIDKKILEIVAEYTEGSFRDAIKTLELLISEGVKLEEADVRGYLFKAGGFDAHEFLNLLQKNNAKEAIGLIEKAVVDGVMIKDLSFQIIQKLRFALLSKVGITQDKEISTEFTKDELIYLVKLFSDAQASVSTSVIEQLPLEVAVIEFTQSGKKDLRKTESAESDEKIAVEKKKDSGGNLETEIHESVNGDGVDDAVWMRVLTEIRPKNSSTEALLRASRPLGFDGKNLTLGVYYKFHKERLEGNPHRDVLEAAISAIFGSPVTVTCSLTEPPQKHMEEVHNDVVSKAGSGVVLTEGQDPVLTEGQDPVLTEGQDPDIIKVAKEVFGS